MEPALDPVHRFEKTNESPSDHQETKTAFSSKSEIFYNKGNEHSCINCFLVMRLERQMHSNETAHISWSYPYTPSKAMSRYPNLAKFAMANAGTSYMVDQLSYTFVLTDSKGVREYGHTTAFVNGEAVVAISPYPWCNFFYRLAYLFVTNGDEGGRRLVKALCKCPTPPSGGMFNTPLDLGLTFNRPYDRLCSFIDTAPLDMLVIFPKMDDLFSILADLMLEKHIIIVGPNFSIVSRVVMSLQALVAPFDWMHILIPILPTSLLNVLSAPPPYLVGILTSQLPHVSCVPLDSVVAVHLGPSGVCDRVDYHNETRDHLPHSGMLSALRTGLSILRMRHPKDQTVRDLCSLFLTYYASLFGEMVLNGANGYVHNKSDSVNTRIFFEKLLCTQSFSILSEEVKKALEAPNFEWMDNEFIVAAVRGQRDVFPSHYEALIQEEKNGGGFVEKYGDCFGSREKFTGLTAALHGFGGHQLGVGRLLMMCLCSHCCGSDLSGENDDSCYYPRNRTGQGILKHCFPSEESPVIMDEVVMTETPSVHASLPNGVGEFEGSISVARR